MAGWKDTKGLEPPDPYRPTERPAVAKMDFSEPIAPQPRAVGAMAPAQQPAVSASGNGVSGVSFGPRTSTPSLSMSSGATTLAKQAQATKPAATATIPSEDTISGMDVAGSVASGLTDQMAANKGMSAQKYASELEEWKAQGKYWFDPNADLMPDLQSYMSDQPSATKALTESTMFGGSTSDSAAAVFNPAGLASGVFGEDADMVTYAEEKGVEGAIAGFATAGPWGALAGAAIGVIEGLFSWSAAEDEDKAVKAKALKEYNKKMQEWTYNRNKRLATQKEQYASAVKGARVAKREKDKAEKETKETKKANAASERRQAMISALSSAGNLSDANRQKRINRWSAA